MRAGQAIRIGPLYWHEAVTRFIEGVLAGHTTCLPGHSRGALDKKALAKLRDYINANLEGPIKVGALASIVGRSPFHFTRVFTRSIGTTPHRFVVHLRLQRALELAREGKDSLADIAASTGFADQSHLTHSLGTPRARRAAASACSLRGIGALPWAPAERGSGRRRGAACEQGSLKPPESRRLYLVRRTALRNCSVRLLAGVCSNWRGRPSSRTFPSKKKQIRSENFSAKAI